MLDPILSHLGHCAASKKATDAVVFDMKNRPDLCDWQVVLSADNDRQSRSIAQSIREDLKSKFGMIPRAVDGLNGGQWILLDYGWFMVHIFLKTVRSLYALEQVWKNAEVQPLVLPS